MSQASLHYLHAFLAVARRGSFSAAASELGVSTSALSQSVQKLESRLGVVLLSRTTRSVAPTAAGQKLAETAGPAVTQALDALRAARTQADEVTGSVRLTVPEIAIQEVVAPIAARFKERYPNVDLDVQVENGLVDIVRAGFDAGVRLEEYIERDMVQLRLTQPNRFVVVGSPRYLAERGEPQHPKDLLEHTCLAYRSSTTGALYHWELERGNRTWRLPVTAHFSSNDARVGLAMAEAGHGLAYVFEPFVNEALTRGTLQIVLEDYAAHVPGMFLYYPSRTHTSPAFRAFVEVARELTVTARSARIGRTNRKRAASSSSR
jgi:DNA-binding transcriptional LysR family regulator